MDDHKKIQEKYAEQDIMQNLIRDRHADRRWRNIRFFGWIFIFLLYAVLIFMPHGDSDEVSLKNKPYVALLHLDGVIMPNSTFSSENVIPQLNDAFRDKHARGVVLVINSPGGSPVQASIIHDKIIELKKEYKKNVIVVGEDSLASGAYLVATAADRIYVNPDTLTGSIGVIMSGFGFNDVMQKVGVSRRVFTSGENKDRLDPFEPLNPQDVAKVKTVLDDVHQSFIQDVMDGRGSRLKGDPKELYSGDFWSGRQAAQLGLVDGTGNLWTILQDNFKTKYYKDYTPQPSLLQRLVSGVQSKLDLHLMYNGSPLRAQAF